MRQVTIVILLFFIPEIFIQAQGKYSEKKTNFSSARYDEFSPSFDGDSIVFCSDRQEELFIRHLGPDKKGLLNLFYARMDDSSARQIPLIFGPELNSPYNNGPITFDSSGTYAIYCRNMAKGKLSGAGKQGGDNLGLYTAELIDGKWIHINPFRYNNPGFSILTPCLTPDGQYLYFSSDMPGGYGGADIYMCKKEGNDWNSPVNLGSIINTPGNEISPYITESGELFFASDGHPGLGKKDLFLSKRVNNEWLRPVHLDPPLNSGYDDFSLITDNSFSKGYFSSDRDGSDDIYEFETVVPQLYNCDSLKENNYCFQFWDNKNPGSDTLKAVFEWQFSDGAVIKGASVEHCFPGAGKYWAFLKVTDTITGENFTVRDSLFFGIEDYKQPYITSKDTLFVSGKAAFNALRSNLPGFKTEEYIWDFGDGESALGPEVVHQYSDPGHYKVKLGIKGKENNKSGSVTYCIFKPVIVMKSNE